MLVLFVWVHTPGGGEFQEHGACVCLASGEDAPCLAGKQKEEEQDTYSRRQVACVAAHPRRDYSRPARPNSLLQKGTDMYSSCPLLSMAPHWGPSLQVGTDWSKMQHQSGVVRTLKNVKTCLQISVILVFMCTGLVLTHSFISQG